MRQLYRRSCRAQLFFREGRARMSETTARDIGEHAADAVDRLKRDWLGVLFDQLVRTAGLLQPDQPSAGDRISLSESYALFELTEGAPLTQRELAERLDLEKSTVSRLVAGLERRELVTRRRNPDNRRLSQVAITGHGRRVLNGMAAAMLEHHARISAAMTAAERDALATGLAALVRAMDQAQRRQGGAVRTRR